MTSEDSPCEETEVACILVSESSSLVDCSFVLGTRCGFVDVEDSDNCCGADEVDEEVAVDVGGVCTIALTYPRKGPLSVFPPRHLMILHLGCNKSEEFGRPFHLQAVVNGGR